MLSDDQLATVLDEKILRGFSFHGDAIFLLTKKKKNKICEKQGVAVCPDTLVASSDFLNMKYISTNIIELLCSLQTK